jgi:hypothetical protein
LATRFSRIRDFRKPSPDIPDEVHDLLRWSDWVRAYRATAEFFDRKLAFSGDRR